jgi:hypothetical protein
MTSPPVKVERRDGPTPAGGAYSIAVYLDEQSREVEKGRRVAQLAVTEYDADGGRLAETWLVRPLQPRNDTDCEDYHRDPEKPVHHTPSMGIPSVICT